MLKTISQSKAARLIARYHGLALPAFAMGMVLAILIPLPTWLMDFLLLVNITLSAVVVLTVMYMDGPLQFTAFPTLLLGMTLFRLVLNTGTTRLILTNAGSGGSAAAGRVIQQFGEFVASGSLAVACIIFAIIVIIQFVVITKGATRIAEVAARFTLDGMPGKQMAVDADLNAGVISDEEAKKRRAEITREADFYGAMDGASKFVRGDAIAGIIITLVNIVGGVLVGWLEHDMDIATTLRTFTILTIGDGLVSQIPAFIVSIAAAMIVTRSASRRNLGQELTEQITSQPVALILAASFLVVLGLTPLPKPPLVLLAASCAAVAYVLNNARKLEAARVAAGAGADKQAAAARPEDQLAPDPMSLEVGYGLIRLVDRKQGGDLLDRITNMRRQLAGELGIIVPPIRIRDEMKLGSNAYRVKVKSYEIGSGEVLPGRLLAINAGTATGALSGVDAKEPAFGLPATWIEPDQRHDAEHKGHTVVEATSVLVTHLSELVKKHAAELLTRQEVNRLLDKLRERSPKLVEEVVPNVLKPGEIQRVLQGLLRERVPIRDLETILETVSDWSERTRDTEILTEYARNALARTLCHANRASDGKIHCVTFDPSVEETINGHVERSERGAFLALPPGLRMRLVEATKSAVERAVPSSGGRPPVVLCAPQIRPQVHEMLRTALPNVAILSYSEIVHGFEVQAHGVITLGDEA
ncbi:MAG: flagellar biosynthesis protein FlhA [Phycisphaerales bacterium]|nr:MAG: flagellar biosynthesis protein FlhA [Phycisphaerales bacterium]